MNKIADAIAKHMAEHPEKWTLKGDTAEADFNGTVVEVNWDRIFGLYSINGTALSDGYFALARSHEDLRKAKEAQKIADLAKALRVEVGS